MKKNLKSKICWHCPYKSAVERTYGSNSGRRKDFLLRRSPSTTLVLSSSVNDLGFSVANTLFHCLNLQDVLSEHIRYVLGNKCAGQQNLKTVQIREINKIYRECLYAHKSF
jgi:hypothetical protein